MNPLDTVFDVQNLPNQQNLENDENPPENWDAELITVPALPRRIFSLDHKIDGSSVRDVMTGC